MEARLAPLYDVFKLNSRLFLNSLDGMDDDQAGWRPTEATNSAAYIALHLVDTRYFMATHLSLTLSNPFAAMTKEARSIRDLKVLPALNALRDTWKSVTGELRVRLGQLTPEELDRMRSAKVPFDDERTLGLVAYLMQHESYHIGQLGLLRRQMGLPAITWR